MASVGRFQPPPPSPVHDGVPRDIDRAIRKAGYKCSKLYRSYAPRDTGCPAEILFLGHELSRFSVPDEPLTAWLPMTAEGVTIISEGWGESPKAVSQ